MAESGRLVDMLDGVFAGADQECTYDITFDPAAEGKLSMPAVKGDWRAALELKVVELHSSAMREIKAAAAGVRSLAAVGEHPVLRKVILQVAEELGAFLATLVGKSICDVSAATAAKAMMAAEIDRLPSWILSLPEAKCIWDSKRIDTTDLCNLAKHRAELRFNAEAGDWCHEKPAIEAATAGRAIKAKRSTERGEARAKLIAALTKHHDYSNGSCLKLEPIGNNELARLAGVAKRTASAFFQKQFNGHGSYKATCADAGRLADALKAMRGEFTPAEFSKMTLEAFEAGKRISDKE